MLLFYVKPTMTIMDPPMSFRSFTFQRFTIKISIILKMPVHRHPRILSTSSADAMVFPLGCDVEAVKRERMH